MIETLKLLDKNLFLKINSHHSNFLDLIMWQISSDWPTYGVILLFIIIFYKKFKLKNMAAMLLGIAIVIACCDLSSNLIKHSVKRQRPSHNTEIKNQIHIVNNYRGGEFGFVSSHASNVFGIITYFFLCVNWLQKRKKILFYIYPLIVVYSRIYLGVHYPLDVLGGSIIGIFFGFIIYLTLKKFFFKYAIEKN